jgi:hypothetical protein
MDAFRQKVAFDLSELSMSELSQLSETWKKGQSIHSQLDSEQQFVFNQQIWRETPCFFD